MTSRVGPIAAGCALPGQLALRPAAANPHGLGPAEGPAQRWCAVTAAEFARSGDCRVYARDPDGHWAAVMDRFRRLPFTVVLTDVDPYTCAEQMAAEARATGRLYLFAGTNEALPREVHWALRAVHDADHVLWGTSFDIMSEMATCRREAAREPQLATLWASEVAGQNTTYWRDGEFPRHRIVAGLARRLEDL